MARLIICVLAGLFFVNVISINAGSRIVMLPHFGSYGYGTGIGRGGFGRLTHRFDNRPGNNGRSSGSLSVSKNYSVSSAFGGASHARTSLTSSVVVSSK